VAQHVDEVREQGEPGLFRGFTPAMVPRTSLPAFALAAVAAARGSELGEQVSLALRDALFEEGRDVADPAVLRDLRERFDLPEPGPEARRAVDGDYEEGRRRGVRGSPEYFLDGQGFFCPALRLDRVDGRLEIAGSDAFDDFVDRCFR
jgi:predicted DsbA family dithiol-disulfide isomerase